MIGLKARKSIKKINNKKCYKILFNDNKMACR